MPEVKNVILTKQCKFIQKCTKHLILFTAFQLNTTTSDKMGAADVAIAVITKSAMANVNAEGLAAVVTKPHPEGLTSLDPSSLPNGFQSKV